MKPRTNDFFRRGGGFGFPCFPAEGKLFKHGSGQMFLRQGALRNVAVWFREALKKEPGGELCRFKMNGDGTGRSAGKISVTP